MATLTFTLEELLEVLKSNNLLHGQIIRSEVKNNCIELVVDTQIFMLPVVPISLKYIKYENNMATFELILASPQLNKAMGMLGNSYQSKLPEYVKLELPNVVIDLQKMLARKNIKGVQVKEIMQSHNQLTIVI